MSTALSSEVRDQIYRYVTGAQQLACLGRWLRSYALTVAEDIGDQDDQELVYAAELLLSEHEAGEWSDAAMLDEFRNLLPPNARPFRPGVASRSRVEVPRPILIRSRPARLRGNVIVGEHDQSPWPATLRREHNTTLALAAGIGIRATP